MNGRDKFVLEFSFQVARAGRSDTALSLGLDQTDGEAAQAGDIIRAIAGADAATILVVFPIEDAGTGDSVVQWSRLISSRQRALACVGGTAGDDVSEIVGKFAGFFDRYAFDGEDLSDIAPWG